MKNKPDIRFDGFTDAWEQCNLGEVSDKVTKKNSKNEFIETFTNSAEHGIINQRDFFDKDISNEKNLNGYYVVNENDFVYNPRISNFAPVGPIKRNKLGRTGVMSPLYYVFKTKNVNKTYLEYYFDTTIWHKFMKLNGDSGARSDRFAIKDSVFKEMPIPYPSEGEQHQIGIFFQSLDNLITLHQRELENYKLLKKGFLQKLFPSNGDTNPLIRFDGFTDAWELRRLSELFSRGGSGGTPRSTNKAYYNGKIPFLGISDISNSNGFIDKTEKYITEEGLNNSSAWIVPAGSISLAMYASVGKLAILNTDVATSQAFYNMVFNDENLRNYVYQSLSKANESGEWTKLISTGTQANLNADKVKNFDISKPTNKEEMAMISSFFMDLDNLITLHQRELDNYKELKKGFLQKMFV